MLNIIRKKPKMNGEVLREKSPLNANNNQIDPAAGTAIKNQRDAPDYAQRQNVLNHQNQPSRF